MALLASPTTPRRDAILGALLVLTSDEGRTERNPDHYRAITVANALKWRDQREADRAAVLLVTKPGADTFQALMGDKCDYAQPTSKRDVARVILACLSRNSDNYVRVPVTEIALACGVHRNTIKRLVRAGKIEARYANSSYTRRFTEARLIEAAPEMHQGAPATTA